MTISVRVHVQTGDPEKDYRKTYKYENIEGARKKALEILGTEPPSKLDREHNWAINAKDDGRITISGDATISEVLGLDTPAATELPPTETAHTEAPTEKPKRARKAKAAAPELPIEATEPEPAPEPLKCAGCGKHGTESDLIAPPGGRQDERYCGDCADVAPAPEPPAPAPIAPPADEPGDCAPEATAAEYFPMVVHPAASIFPMIDAAGLNRLAMDIKANGMREPLQLWNDPERPGRPVLLDGRNRWKVLLMLGWAADLRKEIQAAKPGEDGIYFRWIEADRSALIHIVISLNLHRRHLTPSQCAMVASSVKEVYATAARERQSAAGHRSGEVLEANLPQAVKPAERAPQARDLAARDLGVSGRSVDAADKVRKDGVPELVAAVNAGKVAVSTGAKATALPPEQQREVAATGKLPTPPKPPKSNPPKSEPVDESRDDDECAALWDRAGEVLQSAVRETPMHKQTALFVEMARDYLGWDIKTSAIKT
jgi:hypothetical protein